jgi:hypothetical protein
MGSFGERFDDGMKAGGGDVDEDFFGGGRGIGEGGEAGRVLEGIDDGGVHDGLSSDNLFDSV